MINLSDQPYVVTLKDGTTAADDDALLLIGVSGPDKPHGLVLAARELLWVPLHNILVETQMASYELVGDEDEVAET